MIYIKFSKRVSEKEIQNRIKEFENKFGMNIADFEKKILKGHEKELDEKGILSEYEEWKEYTLEIKKISDGKSNIVESMIQPINTNSNQINILVRVFIPARLAIMNILVKKNTKSISRLSKELKRDRSSVASDLEVLKEAGLVEFEKKGKYTIPVSKYENVAVNF